MTPASTPGIESITSNGERNGVNIARNAFDGHRETFWETSRKKEHRWQKMKKVMDN